MYFQTSAISTLNCSLREFSSDISSQYPKYFLNLFRVPRILTALSLAASRALSFPSQAYQ